MFFKSVISKIINKIQLLVVRNVLIWYKCTDFYTVETYKRVRNYGDKSEKWHTLYRHMQCETL